MDRLKRRILEYIEERNMPTYQFEKKVGVGNSVIIRILDDTVKNPSMETVLKIADVLECSLDELFDREQFGNSLINQSSSGIDLESELLRSVCLYTIHFMEKHEIKTFAFNEVAKVVEKIYAYCLRQKLPLVDVKAANRMLKNNFKLDNKDTN
jgi:transcriptional regulator with XRE-family HTH domain